MLFRSLKSLLFTQSDSKAEKLAVEQLLAGDFASAIRGFSAIVKRNPTSSNWAHLGDALIGSGDPERGRDAFEKALKQDPSFPPALTGLGNAHASLNNHPSAIRLYRQAIARDPGHAPAHNNLALSLMAMGDLEEAWRESEWRYEAASEIGRAHV